MDVLKLTQRMASAGVLARAVPLDRLKDLRREVEELRSNGALDPEFFQDSLTSFDYEVPPKLPEAKTVVVAAWPQPALMVLVHHSQGVTPLTIPPTYADASKVDEEVLKAFEKVFHPDSFRFVKARVPLKVLAARSGLVQYGKNNLTYLPKWGSYHRLTAFFSDMPCPEDPWQDHEILAGCEGCQACIRVCPTKAIPEDRFLYHAERCLTYHNEKDSAVPFPDYVTPEAHNAIVGCMWCQKVCPYNRKVQDWTVLRGEITAEETEILLSGDRASQPALALDGKLKAMGLDLTIFPRNLSALLEKK